MEDPTSFFKATVEPLFSHQNATILRYVSEGGKLAFKVPGFMLVEGDGGWTKSPYNDFLPFKLVKHVVEGGDTHFDLRISDGREFMFIVDPSEKVELVRGIQKAMPSGLFDVEGKAEVSGLNTDNRVEDRGVVSSIDNRLEFLSFGGLFDKSVELFELNGNVTLRFLP